MQEPERQQKGKEGREGEEGKGRKKKGGVGRGRGEERTEGRLGEHG